MLKIKDIYNNPENFIYKLKCGTICFLKKDYSTIFPDKFNYKLVNKGIIFGLRKEDKYYNFRSFFNEIEDFDNYDLYNREEDEAIKLKNNEEYINDGKDYEIIAYKYCNNFNEILINLAKKEEDIVWTWIAKEEVQKR